MARGKLTVTQTYPSFWSYYADFNDEVCGLIKAIEAGTLFKWGLHDRPPLADGALVVSPPRRCGDPMSPFLGKERRWRSRTESCSGVAC